MKRSISPQEKRTIRLATIGLAIYLAIFGGVVVWKRLEKQRDAYRAQLAQATALREKIHIYEDKAGLIKDLIIRYQMDPNSLSRTSIVAQASAALQKAATETGVGLGAIRESNTRGTAHEVAGIQCEGSGQVNAIMSLLYRIDSLGFPLMLDAVQITSDPKMPGALKVNLTIAILDFERWAASTEGTPHA